MAQLLVGTRILDLTRLLPGPFCTQLFSDLGAEVIKIEMPGEGDGARHSLTPIDGYGSTFIMLNRNKKSMTLNLKTQAGAEIFRRLAGNADVVVESFRPGVVDRLGIGFQRLKRDNRKLIYCSLTGFGQDGPYAQRPGHDINYMSCAGLSSLTGKRDQTPVPLGIQAADIASGAMFAAFAVMSALYHRERTGRGQYIDVSMLDGLVAVGQTLFGEYFSTGKVPGPASMRLSGGYPVYNIYETKDNKLFAIGALEEKFWEKLCKLAGRDDLIALHKSGFSEDRDKLESELVKLFKEKTRDEWTKLLADEDTCGTPVLSLDEVMDDPQVKHRELFVKAPHPEQGEVTQVAFPIKFSDLQPEKPGPAPKLGEHTDEVLLSIGYSKKDIREFKKQGVV